MTKDYYDILGVDKSASKEEIKKAYKRLAKKCHPDLNKDDTDAVKKFKELNEAASVLGDDTKRQQYDQFGTTADQFGGGGSRGFDFSDFANFDIFSEGVDFGNIFDSFFGGGQRFGRRRRGPQRGSDLRYDLDITLHDAAFGSEKTISVPRLETCPDCDGTGAKSKNDIQKCDTCEGSGITRETRRTPFGIFSTTTTCSKCRGRGEFIKERCTGCHGNGRVEKTRKIKVEIPAGVEDGTRLRIANEGEAGEAGAPHGDLYVVMNIEPHEFFERHGQDIYCEVPISFVTAALGGEVEVPTLKGRATLKVPLATQTNTVFRMKDKGLPALHGYGTGNQNVRVVVETPKKLTRKQQDLIRQLGKELGEKIMPSKTLFNKIKDAF